MSFGWWAILDTDGKLLSVKNPAALQFLTRTSTPDTYYHALFKYISIFCLAHSPSESVTYTIHVSIVSRLKNHSLICLLPLTTLFEVDLTSYINKGSNLSPALTWSVLV